MPLRALASCHPSQQDTAAGLSQGVPLRGDDRDKTCCRQRTSHASQLVVLGSTSHISAVARRQVGVYERETAAALLSWHVPCLNITDLVDIMPGGM